MSRLTERKKDRYGNEYIATCGGAYFEDESVYKALEKLAHYEDLEEQGLLIEQKQGQWKPTGNIEVLYAKEYACSVCGGIMLGKSEFCPDCGAKLAELKGTEE